MSIKHEDCRSAWGGFLVVGAFKSSALFAPHAACTRRLRKPSQLLNTGQRGPNVRATRASGPYPHPLPNNLIKSCRPVLAARHGTQIPAVRKSSPARSQTAFKSPRD